MSDELKIIILNQLISPFLNSSAKGNMFMITGIFQLLPKVKIWSVKAQYTSWERIFPMKSNKTEISVFFMLANRTCGKTKSSEGDRLVDDTTYRVETVDKLAAEHNPNELTNCLKDDVFVFQGDAALFSDSNPWSVFISLRLTTVQVGFSTEWLSYVINLAKVNNPD